MTGPGDFAATLTLAEARRLSAPMQLAASAEACAAIAARLGLVGIAALTADLRVVPDGDAVGVTGHVRARVTQNCVATGEPVDGDVDTAVLVRFVPVAALEAAEEGAEIELATEELDVIGYTDGRIDVGAMAIDTLALALDPYPRRADADAWLRAHGVKAEEDVGAFSALAALRDKLSK